MATQTKAYKSHNKYTSCVKFSQSANIFASCSYDHTVKIWDVRSIFPIETLASHHDKVFSIHWKDNSELVSGGSDSKICGYTSFLQKNEWYKILCIIFLIDIKNLYVYNVGIHQNYSSIRIWVSF